MNPDMLFNLREGDTFDASGEEFDIKNDVIISASGVTVKNISISAAIVVNADGVTLENCASGAITSVGNDFVAEGCSANKIEISGAQNALLSKCSADAVSVTDCYNCSVVLNRAKNIECRGNKNVYVIENVAANTLCIQSNDYVIAESNEYGALFAESNGNVNGNTLTDVDARPEFGADEQLRPHVNKEQFVGMPKRHTVKSTSLTIPQYIRECAVTTKKIVIPPGSYAFNEPIYFDSELSGVTIYAYGVYYEYTEPDYAHYTSKQIEFQRASDINIYGLTVGYNIPSAGQIRVLDKFIKDDRYCFTVVSDAGFWDGFGKTDPELYNTTWCEFFLVDENGEYRYRADENIKHAYTVERNYDENGNYTGTMTFSPNGRGDMIYGEFKSAKTVWNRVKPGTVIICRLAKGNRRTIWMSNVQNITFRDVTLYGYSAAFSAYANGVSENINFVRFYDTTTSPYVIDKQTYDKYRAIEQKWGVDCEVREQKLPDGTVRYRGAPPRASSVDGIHTSQTTKGANFVSCVVECMVDDGTNQHTNPSRLHNIVNNGDGTTTIYYKGHMSDSVFRFTPDGATMGLTGTPNFGKGQKIFVYSHNGHIICDTVTLNGFSSAENDPQGAVDPADTVYTDGNKTCYVYPTVFKVDVATIDVNWNEILDSDGNIKYKINDNSYTPENIVYVDNVSLAAGGYVIDNMLVRYSHSRGFLVKSRDIEIKHCTFDHVSLSGVLMRPEMHWGESSFAQNVSVSQCLFDKVGFLHNGILDPDQACIRIQGTSDTVDELSLPIKNISITGCKFTNNEQRYAIRLHSAKNVCIRNNVFDPTVKTQAPESDGAAVLIDTCMNIEISDNTYNYEHFNGDVRNVIKGKNYKNVFGKDVTDENGAPLIPDSIN